MIKIEVAIIEAGDDYTERLEVFEIEEQDTEAATVEAAKAAVADRGYRVMSDDEGGCCEYASVSDAPAYVAITVWPNEEDD